MAKSSTWKNLLGGVIVIGLAVVALVWYAERQEGGTPSPMQNEVAAEEWMRGPAAAKVTLIEYSDFQCPACRNFQPLVTRIISEYPNDLRVVYRHFPLRNIHAYAAMAAEASEAAGAQGKFWEFHDLLFDRQSEWSQKEADRDALFAEYAAELGLDATAFADAANGAAARDAVKEDERSGLLAHIDSTPTFFLNGTPLSFRSAQNDEQVLEILRNAINAKLAEVVVEDEVVPTEDVLSGTQE